MSGSAGLTNKFGAGQVVSLAIQRSRVLLQHGVVKESEHDFQEWFCLPKVLSGKSPHLSFMSRPRLETPVRWIALSDQYLCLTFCHFLGTLDLATL